MVGFTPPNRYQPRPGWEGRLSQWMPMPPAASWQSDMIQYYLWRTNDKMKLMPAWTKLRMTPGNAQTALDPASGNDRGLIPPEIFSRVLARSQASDIQPNDNVADVIIEPAPGAAPAVAAMAPRARPARKKAATRKAAKRKTAKRKSAKPAKRKTAKRKVAAGRSRRGRAK